MEGDPAQDRKEHRIARHLETELHRLLQRYRCVAGHRAAPHAVTTTASRTRKLVTIARPLVVPCRRNATNPVTARTNIVDEIPDLDMVNTRDSAITAAAPPSRTRRLASGDVSQSTRSRTVGF